MGAAGSSEDVLRREELVELSVLSGFAPERVGQLYARFKKIDSGGRGSIARKDLLRIPELSLNPLASRLLSELLGSEDEGARVNFRDFLEVLAIFYEPGPGLQGSSWLRGSQWRVQDKVHACGDAAQRRIAREKLVFGIFDEDKDGFLTTKELGSVLKSMVGTHMESSEIETICESLLLELDRDGDGKISFEEFHEGLGGPGGIADSVLLPTWRDNSDPYF